MDILVMLLALGAGLCLFSGVQLVASLRSSQGKRKPCGAAE
jgi:hypothetical protein